MSKSVNIRVVCKRCSGLPNGWCGDCRGSGEIMQAVSDEILRGDRVDLAAYLVGRRLEVMEVRLQR